MDEYFEIGFKSLDVNLENLDTTNKEISDGDLLFIYNPDSGIWSIEQAKEIDGKLFSVFKKPRIDIVTEISKIKTNHIVILKYGKSGKKTYFQDIVFNN